MIETMTESMFQYGAIGIVLAYFIYKDYKLNSKMVETMATINERLDERLPAPWEAVK